MDKHNTTGTLKSIMKGLQQGLYKHGTKQAWQRDGLCECEGCTNKAKDRKRQRRICDACWERMQS